MISTSNIERGLNRQASNKSGRTHIVPLSNLALETIRSMPRVHDELVFPARGKDNPVSGYTKWKSKLDQLSGVTDWTFTICGEPLPQAWLN